MRIVWIAGELMPCQGQPDEPLPIGAFGLRGPPHRGLGFVLWIVPDVHKADLAGHLDKRVTISSV